MAYCNEPTTKKQKRTYVDKCVICCKALDDSCPYVKCPTSGGMTGIIQAADIRQDEVYARLSEIKDDILNGSVTVRYHTKCRAWYTSASNLNCVQKQPSSRTSVVDIDDPPGDSGPVRLRRSDTSSFNIRTDCFLCGSANTRKEKLTCVSTGTGSSTGERIIKAALDRKDDEIHMRMLSHPDLFAYDAKYRRSCYSRCVSDRNIKADQSKAEAQTSLSDVDKAVLRLGDEIEKTALSKAKDRMLVTLSSLHAQFIELFNEGRPPEDKVGPRDYPSWKLKHKLQKLFGDRLLFIAQPGLSELVCSAEVTVGDALKRISALHVQINDLGECEYTSSDLAEHPDCDSVILHRAAGILRNAMSGITFQSTHYSPSSNLNTDHCKAFVPQTVYDFVAWCTSKDEFDKAAHSVPGECDLRVLGICHSIIGLSCNTQTPITFGLGVQMHHDHGSRDLIERLSSLGFSINYGDVRKFLTSVAIDELTESPSVPISRGISKFDGENTATVVDAAIDNFDQNEETVDGKHTTHSMAIVLYQRSLATPESDLIPCSKQKSLDTAKYKEQPVHAYRKPGKKPEPVITRQTENVTNATSVPKNDLVWEMARVLGDDDSCVPAWSGFNALVSTKSVPAAKIRYLPFINASPSDLSTIFTTLLRLVETAQELGQPHILVTADLAIYSKAQQILWSRPKSLEGKVTMRLGGMHLTMAFLASIGKLFGDGGLHDILVSSEVYASATANQMLQGKQYARAIRCIRLAHEALTHLFLTAAEDFATKNSLPWVTGETKHKPQALEEPFRSRDATACAAACHEVEDSIADSVLHTIALFREEGRQRSATFAYWDSFLQAGDTLLRLLRADREAKFLMHIEAVKDTVPYFVLAGRINYARYTPVYVAEMELLEEKQPLMYRHMIEGGFVVRRSKSRVFNCVPTDQALEQSINREAKSQGGVIGFTLQKGALLRWLMTRHITGEYAEAFKNICNSSSKDKLHDELGDTRLRRDKKDVKEITEYLLRQCQDPFNRDDVPESLINITTGQVASEKVENSLRNIPENGKTVADGFIKERLGEKPTKSFWDPLNKTTVLTFADMKKALPNDKDRKLIIDTEVLFRRLLAVARSRDVDLKNVLRHELAAVPPALFNDDGRMRKTNKADLAQKLESNCADVVASLPQAPDATSSAYIIDGMAVIQSLNENHFRTFNDLAEVVQKRIVGLLRNRSLSLSSVTIVFDRYDNPSSIKSAERERRGSHSEQAYQISGNRQVPNYRKFLKGSRNKASLAEYISNYIIEHVAEYLPNDTSVVLAGGFSEATLVKSVSTSAVQNLESLYCNQEEADTRMILHACHLSQQHGRLIVRCDDTDVLVLLVHYHSGGHLSDEVYMYAGHSGKERYIPVHCIAKELGPLVCGSLPAAHALTGCDTTSSLYRIGKKSAYSKLVKYADSLTNLHSFHNDDLDGSVAAARKFVLLLYAGKKGKDINTLDELRYVLATTTDKTAAMLPPTEDSFKQHVLRAKYQTRLWCQSHIASQEVVEPVGHGWSACDGGIAPTMFVQAPAPIEVRDLTHLYCTDKDCQNARKCPCRLAGLECIDACSCSDCKNQSNSEQEGSADTQLHVL